LAGDGIGHAAHGISIGFGPWAAAVASLSLASPICPHVRARKLIPIRIEIWCEGMIAHPYVGQVSGCQLYCPGSQDLWS
jgi:hypothetical protein